ncbi:unnamed protein product [Penicillium camemberti]|uniref:Str. FM013 n=1 Tax=Penicillium camemberti (strain FM 013) TaxID=1429867 RepID=A0A0G4PWJ8_PENC3|nr:unnamed protein product [Penicillium camemberti]
MPQPSGAHNDVPRVWWVSMTNKDSAWIPSPDRESLRFDFLSTLPNNSFSLSQQEADTRQTLATEPFQPILKVRVDLERDDPKFAFPAARLVGLYRCLWESYVSKLQAHRWPEAKAEQSDLEGGWYAPEKKEGGLQALELSQERLVSILDDRNHPSRLSDAGFFDNAREG